LGSGTGGASYGILRGSGSPGIMLEALFVLETTGGRHLHVDRFLPNTPIRVVVDHTGENVSREYTSDMIDQKLIAGQIDDLISNETLVETIIPNMIDAATEIAESMGMIEISSGLRMMNRTMDHEIGRLKSLQQKNKHIRPDEIQIAEAEKAKLEALMKDARIRLDAVQLIRKGG
jgi:ATP-dependent helicase HepA